MMFCSVVGAILDCGGIQAIYFAHVHDALIMLILISNMADVLDEQEEVLQDMECTDMDYRKMRQSQEAAGYREGMESGKEASLQQGFNDGFIYGASVSREWAKLRGVLSALMLFVSSNSVQVLHPNITNEITELLALVCQMENKALSTQNMKDVIQDQINPQDQCSLEKSENGGASLTHHKVVTKGRTVNEHELLVAFEMLDTQDGSTNGIDDLRSRCEQSENVVGKRCSKDPALPEKFFNCSQTPVETFKIKCNDMEHLWTMIVSLADRLGINEQKILAVKNI